MLQSPVRARDLGVVVGGFEVGEHNAITDVPGVLVGQATVIEGTDIRTGVTAIVPTAVVTARGTLPAAFAVGNTRWRSLRCGRVGRRFSTRRSINCFARRSTV
jgi:hypothetical protein